jgi:hypothetical protein
MNGIVLNK